jgi:hypothetical protein
MVRMRPSEFWPMEPPLNAGCAHCSRPNGTPYQKCELCRATQRKYDGGEKRKAINIRRDSAKRKDANLLAARLYRHNKRMDRLHDPRYSRKSGLQIIEMYLGVRFEGLRPGMQRAIAHERD